MSCHRTADDKMNKMGGTGGVERLVPIIQLDIFPDVLTTSEYASSATISAQLLSPCFRTASSNLTKRVERNRQN